MEWRTLRHLEVGAHAQAAAFHPTQPLVSVSVGRSIIEYDLLTGCQLAKMDIGGPVVRMGYAPAAGHVIVAVMEDHTIRCWDHDSELTAILFTPPDRRGDKPAEVHLAICAHRPWAFFAAHRRTSIHVVGVLEGIRPATKLKAEFKKPITALACHPRHPVLFVAYAEGIIRAHHVTSFNLLYTLSLDDPSVKLMGAAAMVCHHLLDHIFVGDRSGSLLAWDVSVPARPNLIGFLQVAVVAVMACVWHAPLDLLLVLTRDGTVKAYSPHIHHNPALSLASNSHFFHEYEAVEVDVERLLVQAGGQSVVPVPRIRTLHVHPTLNFLLLLFLREGAAEDVVRKREQNRSKASRRALLDMLQSARGAPDPASQRDKLSSLGPSALMSDQQLQEQLVLTRGQTKLAQPTLLDFARKAYLYGATHGGLLDTAGHLTTLPLIQVLDPLEPANDLPVAHPFHAPLLFYNSEQAIFRFPSRIALMDGCSIVSFSLATGVLSSLKKLPPVDGKGQQRRATHMVYSQKQQCMLVFFETARTAGGGGVSMVVQRYLDVMEPLGEGLDTLTDIQARDGAFIGHHDKKLALLGETGYVLTLFPLQDPNKSPQELEEEEEEKDEQQRGGGKEKGGDESETTFTGFGSRFDEVQEEVELKQAVKGQEGPVEFTFETPVHRVFPTPMEDSLLYVALGSHLGMVNVLVDEYGRPAGDLVEADGLMWLSTRKHDKAHLPLKLGETVLQVWWQKAVTGHVAAVMTTMRLLIVAADLSVLASTTASSRDSHPPFTSCLWVGPALLFTTDSAVFILGWDSVVRPIVALSSPNSVLLAALNDRLVVATGASVAVGRVATVDVQQRLTGLLEPLLAGWVSLVHSQGPHPMLHLPKLISQLISRFDVMRLTPRLVELLSRGPTICCQLALELSETGPQFNSEVRVMSAMRARNFDKALDILTTDFHHSTSYPRCPPSSRLFHRFRQLGRRCITFAQFDKAKATFEVVGDYEAMYDLFIAHMNPSALRRLAATLEESEAQPELERECMQVLKVRSSLWNQGGVLSAIAQEALAPKPADWAGGNWTVLVAPDPSEAKPAAGTAAAADAAAAAAGAAGGANVGAAGAVTAVAAAAGGLKPQAEISHSWTFGNEVTAYMKTEGGAIPVIMADSVGVYLGVARGKGVVTEILEMKKEEAKKEEKKKKKKATEAEIMAAAVASFLPGAEAASAAAGGAVPRGEETAEEAQQRAAAEFKTSMYGAGEAFDSDSDDDTMSTTSRRSKFSIKIKDKDARAGVVDVGRLKAASKTLTLGAPAKPPSSAATEEFGWQQFESDSSGLAIVPFGDAAAAAAAQPAANGMPPAAGGPVWANPPGLAALGMGAGGGVPAQAVALGYAKPMLPPGQQGAAGPEAGAAAAAAAAAAAGAGGAVGAEVVGESKELFGDDIPFSAEPSFQAAQPAQAEAAAAGTGKQRPMLPPPSAGPLQMQPAATAAAAAEPAAQEEFGGLLAGTAEGQGRGEPGQQLKVPLPKSAAGAEGAGANALPPEISALSDAQAAGEKGPSKEQEAARAAMPTKILPGYVPRGASAAVCVKVALVHVDDNRLADALACVDEAFLAMAKDRSLGKNVQAQARIAAHYKIGATILQEIVRLQKAEGQGALGAKEEMARLARHLASLPLQPKHRISCARTAIRRNMEVHNFAYSNRLLHALLAKAPPNKQAELRALANICMARGLTDRTINRSEDPSRFCAASLALLPTIGHDVCDTCNACFAALATPGCPICGMGTVRRFDKAGAGAAGAGGGGAAGRAAAAGGQAGRGKGGVTAFASPF